MLKILELKTYVGGCLSQTILRTRYIILNLWWWWLLGYKEKIIVILSILLYLKKKNQVNTKWLFLNLKRFIIYSWWCRQIKISTEDMLLDFSKGYHVFFFVEVCFAPGRSPVNSTKVRRRLPVSEAPDHKLTTCIHQCWPTHHSSNCKRRINISKIETVVFLLEKQLIVRFKY